MYGWTCLHLIINFTSSVWWSTVHPWFQPHFLWITHFSVYCFLTTFPGYDTTSYSKWICKSWFFVNHSAKTISGWTLVSVTFERLLVVYFPLKVKSICTKGVAFRTLAFISTIGIVVHLHYFWSYGPSFKEVNGTHVVTATCSVSHEYPELQFYMAHIRPRQDFLLRSAIPFTLLLICNVMILCKMYLESRSRRELTQTSNDNNTTMKSLTPMLLTVSFIYLVCISPMQIM